MHAHNIKKKKSIMKKAFATLPMIIVSISLTSCFFSCGGDGWKEEWGTPELFLESIRSDDPYIYLYENQDRWHDTNFEVKNAIKESGPFTSIDKREPTVDRYFTYQGYWQAATSGPNYCNMSIYDDGLMIIHHKYSLGGHGYAYFSMDATKAIALNDLVFTKIPYEKQVTNEDNEQAILDGGINNFFTAMEAKVSAPVKYTDFREDGEYYFKFHDFGELLNLMKTANYEEAKNSISFSDLRAAVSYNYPVNEKPNEIWTYRLDRDAEMVKITYGYTNRLGASATIHFYYLIDSSIGNSFIAKAADMAL